MPEKGEFGHKYQILGCYLFKSSCYIHLSAGIWQNCLVLTFKGFVLFILLVKVAFSLVVFPFAVNREIWQSKTGILSACLSTYKR